MRVLKDCYIGPEIYGVYSATIPLRRYIVYCQDIKELVGFRTAQDIIRTDKVTYIEVGTFFNMLYEHYFSAWQILTCNTNFVDTDEFIDFYEGYEHLISSGLIESLVKKSIPNVKKINEKFVDYGESSYLCGEQVMIAESLILSRKFTPSKPELLQSILDCKLHQKTVKSELRKCINYTNKHLRLSDLPVGIDKDYLNTVLLKIRGV